MNDHWKLPDDDTDLTYAFGQGKFIWWRFNTRKDSTNISITQSTIMKSNEAISFIMETAQYEDRFSRHFRPRNI